MKEIRLRGRRHWEQKKGIRTFAKKKKKVKRCIYQSKKEVNEQFGRKMNQYVDGNKKSFWKDVSKVNGRKVESCSRI